VTGAAEPPAVEIADKPQSAVLRFAQGALTSTRLGEGPAQTFKAREIAIEADEGRVLFERQGGEMRIGGQIAGGAGGLQQASENFPTPRVSSKPRRMASRASACRSLERLAE